MALSEELKKKLDYYEQAYFYTDSPVPFLGDLKIYPVMSKDYYNFYSNLSCLTMDKTIIKTIVKNEETGKEEEKIKPNPKGISMSYEAYLISQMEDKQYGQLITQQVINMLELCLHEQNGLFCPNCGKKISNEDVLNSLRELAEEFNSIQKSEGNEEKLDKDGLAFNQRKFQLLSKLSMCDECGAQMREIFSIKNAENDAQKRLCIYNHEIEPKQFDEMIAIILHQNILDYDGDRYIDPNLKKDLELKARLQNKNYSSPSLEKQLVCVSISSPYRMEELKEEVTLRKLSLMLKTIDAKNYYYAQVQGQMSGMVEFKNEPNHWIFGENKRDVSKEIMSMNDVQRKFASVT